MKNNLCIWIIVILIVGFIGNFYVLGAMHMNHMQMMGDESHDHGSNMNMADKRMDFIDQKNKVISELLPQGKYRCCLDKPCTYCIEKTPGHGEGAICDCLADIMNGVHPCGECIGEILEGHGNRFLAPYFAKAITEKTGEEEAIKRIIEEKYGVAVEDQV